MPLSQRKKPLSFYLTQTASLIEEYIDGSISTCEETVESPLAPPSLPCPPLDVMSGLDRTQEFFSTVKLFQSRPSPSARYNNEDAFIDTKLKKQQSWQATFHDYKLFSQAAKRIGQDLSQTYSKLEKLTLVIKNKSIFDDKSSEIETLTAIIKQDITTLNRQIVQLQEFKNRKTQASVNKNTQNHSNCILMSLQMKLANMSGSFKNILEERTQNMKEQRMRKERFSNVGIPSSSDISKRNNVFRKEGQLSQRNALANSAATFHRDTPISPFNFNASCEDDDDITDEEKAIRLGQINGLDAECEAKFMQIQSIHNTTNTYITERADAMKEIESTIVELGTIFNQLASMVKEQDEMIFRIDNNVEESSLNVEAAHRELLKYFRSISSNRWLMFKIFSIVILFIIIFITFFS